MKKYRVGIVSHLRSGDWHSPVEVVDLNDLVKHLDEEGVETVDIKCYPPWDNTPDTIKADILINDLTEADFDHLAKTTEFKPFLDPCKRKPKKKDEFELTIHRGTHEIGGTCIEMRAKDTRIIMDIGIPLVDDNGDEFDFSIYKDLSIEELIAKEILPNVKGLYKNTQPEVDAIFISHAHLDHYGFLSYVHPDIPVYLSRGTKELIDISKYFGVHSDDIKDFRIIPAWKSVTIGSFSITPYLVDHSAFDSFAYLIEANTKRLFYTGDFSGHGRKSNLFDNIVKNPPLDIDYLLMEGSTLDRDQADQKSEYDLEKDLELLLMKGDPLQMISCSSQNIDRLVSTYKACVRSNRTFVIDPYTAYVLKKLGTLASIPQHDWGKHIKVFFVPNSRTSKLLDDKIGYRYQPSKITIEEILSGKNNILLKDNHMLRQILANKNMLNGITWYWSMWEGYLKDQMDFINANQINLIQAHVSGHAYESELLQFTNAIAPKKLIPIHTFHPERFKELSDITTIDMNDKQGISL